MLQRLAIVIVLIATLCLVIDVPPRAAAAASHSVCPLGCDFTSVQAAIDVATTGDTIDIATGVFPAQLTIRSKMLSLQGAGANETVLDGEHAGRVLFVDWDAVVTLRDVSVRNGRAEVSPSFPAGNGGGIFVTNGGTLTISRSTITGNTAAGQGGGIANRGTLTISGSEVSGNRAEKSGGGIYNSRRLTIDTSNIIGNQTSSSGGGLYNTDQLSVSQSTVADNSASAGGGVFNDGNLGETGTVELQQVVLHNNEATGDGGGLFNAAGGTITIGQTAMTGNRAGKRGGGLYLDSDSAIATSGANLTESLLSQNRAAADGGGLYRASGTLTLDRTAFWNNQPNDCAPQARSCSSSSQVFSVHVP